MDGKISFDSSTGEVCPKCESLEKERNGLETDLRAWRRRYADLKYDRDAEAKKHPHYGAAKRVHRYWKKACRHPRSGFKTLHFELIQPFLEDEKRYGEEMCHRAIEGAAYDPFITTLRNGKRERHDHVELIFKSAKSFERFANKAPADWEELRDERLLEIKG